VPLAVLQEHLAAREALALLLLHRDVDSDAVLETLGGSEPDSVTPGDIFGLLRG
jgi:hypothetical protein